jgi:hypothetical protein
MTIFFIARENGLYNFISKQFLQIVQKFHGGGIVG